MKNADFREICTVFNRLSDRKSINIAGQGGFSEKTNTCFLRKTPKGVHQEGVEFIFSINFGLGGNGGNELTWGPYLLTLRPANLY